MERFDKLKSWKFPKVHTHAHAPGDVRRKGVSRNYNTKPNEKAHGILKKFYLFKSNFKNVEITVSMSSYIVLLTVLPCS